MKINFKKTAITSIIALLPMIIGIVLLPRLPEKVAVHWNSNNTPDTWMNKYLAVFGLPSFMAVFQFAFCLITYMKSENGEAKLTKIMLWVIPILSHIVFYMTMFFALGAEFDIGLIVGFLMGILFIVIGNYLPKVPQEQNGKLYAKNIPPENYRKLMKRTGVMFFVLGILILVSLLLVGTVLPIIMGIGLISIIVVFFISFLKR
jgi:uncharacterized membrane protein